MDEASMKAHYWVIQMHSPYYRMSGRQCYAGYFEKGSPVLETSWHHAAQFKYKFDADLVAAKLPAIKDFIWVVREAKDVNCDCTYVNDPAGPEVTD
jgi:hypothetical protein